MAVFVDEFNLPPGPVEQLKLPRELENAGVSLWVKRDDLLRFPQAPELCGNKIRKLKYNLQAAMRSGKERLLTFGGAYSNHIAAVAAAGFLFGFKTIGVIRGEPVEPLNPVLHLARERGMELHYLDRAAYRRRNEPGFQEELIRRTGDPYLLPEGGTNDLAAKGAAELVGEAEQQLGWLPDQWLLAAGTGGTSAGIAAGLDGVASLTAVAAVKDPGIGEVIRRATGKDEQAGNWSVNFDYTFGGYAKKTQELTAFIQWFGTAYRIPVEPIYTGKAFFAVFDLIKNGYFSPGSRILVVHTGGV
ncbi:MAG TPA: pyridoxal-phosphate dependent enzyme [Flavilitoribacter sp.]|nr:pyridoxal-phosphate dependent enzyme [Flavilitoribacter sp.]HMQ89246.1 pyridoxal-phosphate dependent enzyme [Flavilitoribacter sp.]